MVSQRFQVSGFRFQLSGLLGINRPIKLSRGAWDNNELERAGDTARGAAHRLPVRDNQIIAGLNVVDAPQDLVAGDRIGASSRRGDGQPGRAAVIDQHSYRTRGPRGSDTRSGDRRDRIQSSGNVAPDKIVGRCGHIPQLYAIGEERHVGDAIGGVKGVGLELDRGRGDEEGTICRLAQVDLGSARTAVQALENPLTRTKTFRKGQPGRLAFFVILT